MIEIRKATGTDDDDTIRTVSEIVFSGTDIVNADHRAYEFSNPPLARMIRDTFAEAVSNFLKIVQRNEELVLTPIDCSHRSDHNTIYLACTSRSSEPQTHVHFFIFNAQPTLGLVLTIGGQLSMRFTASSDVTDRLLKRQATINRSFDLLANARHVAFMRTEVPR